MEILLLVVIVLAVMAGIPAAAAAEKGKSFWAWFAYGVAVWPIALIATARG